MSASRFAIDLTEVSSERIICPKGTFPMRIAKAEVRTGNKDGRNWMMLNLTLAVRDPEVATIMNQDEPKVFYTIGLSFDKETEQFLPKNNADFGALLDVCDLKTKEATEAFMEGTDDVDSFWDFNKVYFANVAASLSGFDVIGQVDHKKSYNDPTRMEASVTKLAKA